MPQTSRRLTIHPITLREVELARAVDITPGLRRLTFTGPQLGAFVGADDRPQPAFRSDGFDDDIRIVFPHPVTGEVVLPVQEEGHLDWPRDPRPLSRAYTVRRWDPTSGELDVDVVRHGTGIATTWAYRARPGDRLHVAGPAASGALPDADWLLVAGDDTALPAIARLVESLPRDARGQVFVEVAEAGHRLELAAPPGVSVTWLVRGQLPAGATPMLHDAVVAADWWPGRVFAWLAGEAAVVREIRRHLVSERGLAKADVDFTGYWRRGEVVTLADDPATPDPERTPEAFERLHDLAELIPPLAIRAAVALGIPDLLSTGPQRTATAVAQRTGAHPVGVHKLLRYLQAIDVVAPDGDGGYRLTETGDWLTDDFVVDVLHPDGSYGRQERALWGLIDAVRTGAETHTAITGQSYAQLREQPWYEAKVADAAATFGQYRAGPLADTAAVRTVGDAGGHVVVRSVADGVLAQTLTDRYPGIRVTVAALPTHLRWLRDELVRTVPDPRQRDRIDLHESPLFETVDDADAVLLVLELGAHPTPDAALALRRAAAGLRPGGRVLLVEDTFDTDTLDEHDAEADLLALALHGTGHRTGVELDDVIAAAGLQVEAAKPFGWGATLRVLTPQPAGPR